MELQKGDHQELVNAYLSGNISEEERDRLLQWVKESPARMAELRALEKIWERSANYEIPTFNLQTAWEKIQKKIGDREKFGGSLPEQGPVKLMRKPGERTVGTLLTGRLSRSSLQIAASIIFLFLVGVLLYFFLEPQVAEVQVVTVSGEIKSFALPDGSHVVLNENSSLSFLGNLDQQPERRINLEGEAFFEVIKDPERTFIVRAGETETRVLGTSFNVLSDTAGRQVKISLLSGKVRFVPAEEAAPVVLVSGEEAIYQTDDQSVTKRPFRNKNFLSWKSRKLEFNDEPLRDVLAAVGKHYGITFHIKNPQLNGLRITSSFDDDSLDEVLHVLENLLDIRIINHENSYDVEAN